MGQAENFNPQNLYHKINGKADLYLASGFVSLKAQRYHLEGDPNSWLEMLAYQMKSPRAAFAVYSQQRRPDAKPLDGIAGTFPICPKTPCFWPRGLITWR